MASEIMPTLPPGVLGESRGSLTLMLSEIAFSTPKSSAASKSKPPLRGEACVRIKWWGEASEGVVLYPPTANTQALPASGRRGSTTAAYSIACGPQQLARYLMDMRTLVLDIHPAPGPSCSGYGAASSSASPSGSLAPPLGQALSLIHI